jgi:hypothetical protein
MKRIALIATILPAVFLCSRSPLELGGGSTSTGNERVIGTAVYPGGLPASRAKVISRRSDYVPNLVLAHGKERSAILAETITDSLGRFAIDSIDTGEYCIEVNDRLGAAVLFKTFVGPKTGGTLLLSDTLRPYASIEGTVSRSSSLPMYCRVYGLERTVALDSSGHFALSDLPAGTYDIIVASPDTSYPPERANGIKAVSGATAHTPFQNWSHSRRLYLNTTASGANTAGPVEGFPILVRLTQNNFNFAEARDNGADLRFAKPDGTFLPYEIERFDPAAQKAEIWVKVDTVYGNDSAHCITMYWGNPQAAAVSSGPAVFDTADGFAAVWHLNLNCTDAGCNQNDGVNSSALDTDGIIGNAKKFNGADSIKIAGLLGAPSNITLSAWTQLDSVGTQGSEIISLGDAVLIRMDDYRPNYGVMGAVHLYTLPGDTVHYNFVSGQKLNKTGWHHIALTIDAINFVQVLYIDGIQSRRGTSKNSVIDYTGVGRNTFIGKHGNGKNIYNFTGRIDEVRVSTTVLSADWMKLCYMNQKAQDALVVFR